MTKSFLLGTILLWVAVSSAMAKPAHNREKTPVPVSPPARPLVSPDEEIPVKENLELTAHEKKEMEEGLEALVSIGNLGGSAQPSVPTTPAP